MKQSTKYLITLATAILVLFIGVSDYSGWTDRVSGRDMKKAGIERLSSTKGYPEIIIFDDEREFRPLWNLIRKNTSDPITLEKIREGKIPSAIVRLGGTLTAPVGETIPEGIDPRYVPDSSPVLVFYNYKRGVGPDTSVPEDERIARPIGNIGDLKSWLQKSKEAERFFFSIMLVGILSVSLAFIEWRTSLIAKV
jgi:hypothetical protein